jgi:ADP-heptose:LPS heptosyltransferase
VGDLRERLTLLLIGAPRLHSPEWETGHPFRRHIRAMPFRSDQAMSVPASMPNLYEAQTLMLQTIAPGAIPDPDIPHRMPLRKGRALHIGLHPSASAPFKRWPAEHWSALVTMLYKAYPGSRFILFGAPNDQIELEGLAARLDAPHELFISSLREFKACLSDLDLLFGLDSLAVHLAHSQGVPSVVLVGANDPRIFTPPSGLAVTHPGRCSVQPCGGRPNCVGASHQYSCMVDILPKDAMQAAFHFLPAQTL